MKVFRVLLTVLLVARFALCENPYALPYIFYSFVNVTVGNEESSQQAVEVYYNRETEQFTVEPVPLVDLSSLRARLKKNEGSVDSLVKETVTIEPLSLDLRRKIMAELTGYLQRTKAKAVPPATEKDIAYFPIEDVKVRMPYFTEAGGTIEMLDRGTKSEIHCTLSGPRKAFNCFLETGSVGKSVMSIETQVKGLNRSAKSIKYTLKHEAKFQELVDLMQKEDIQDKVILSSDSSGVSFGLSLPFEIGHVGLGLGGSVARSTAETKKKRWVTRTHLNQIAHSVLLDENVEIMEIAPSNVPPPTPPGESRYPMDQRSALKLFEGGKATERVSGVKLKNLVAKESKNGAQTLNAPTLQSSDVQFTVLGKKGESKEAVEGAPPKEAESNAPSEKPELNAPLSSAKSISIPLLSGGSVNVPDSAFVQAQDIDFILVDFSEFISEMTSRVVGERLMSPEVHKKWFTVFEVESKQAKGWEISAYWSNFTGGDGSPQESWKIELTPITGAHRFDEPIPSSVDIEIVGPTGVWKSFPRLPWTGRPISKAFERPMETGGIADSLGVKIRAYYSNKKIEVFEHLVAPQPR